MGAGREKDLVLDFNKISKENDQLKAQLDKTQTMLQHSIAQKMQADARFRELVRIFGCVLIAAGGELEITDYVAARIQEPIEISRTENKFRNGTLFTIIGENSSLIKGTNLSRPGDTGSSSASPSEPPREDSREVLSERGKTLRIVDTEFNTDDDGNSESEGG